MSDPQPRHPRSFQVVVKPVGATCNLDCTYCYHHYKEATAGRIADDLLEKFIRQYIADKEEDPVVFIDLCRPPTSHRSSPDCTAATAK